jgi:GNAT superfamily N-acetyltransferase
METIHYQPLDETSLPLVAGWYQSEWNMPPENTLNKLRNLQAPEVHLVQLLDGAPVATGGVHRHVPVIDRYPHLAVHPYWLALVYTQPVLRGRGLGAALCTKLQMQAKAAGMDVLHLFTHTAESLYTRLGWEVTERIAAGGKDIAVMKFSL